MNNRSSLERTSTRLRLEHQNAVVKRLLRDFEESSTQWVWEIGPDIKFRNKSPRFFAALEAMPLDMMKAELEEVALNDSRIEGLSDILQLCRARQPFRDKLVRFDLEHGLIFWSLSGQPIYDESASFQGYRGIARDVTEGSRNEVQIRYLSGHDSLTGLPNRARFMAELERFCLHPASSLDPYAGLGRASPIGFALLLLDLDRFKEVNDLHGHATGDVLLAAVAERLRRVVREGAFIARLGGDEFGILAPLGDPCEANAIAGRVLETLHEPYGFGSVTVHPGASLGFTIAPKDGAEPARLLRNADLALYSIKARARGTSCAWRPEMEPDQLDRAMLRNELKTATAAEQFYLEYQPIIDLASGERTTMEALIRWNHPILGPISPSVFIPIAEESGLIRDIGAWVLNRACRAATLWPETLRLAVNVSALQIHDPRFLDRLDRALQDSGLAPSRLEIELTERVLLDANAASFATVAELHRRRVRIILDDFGSGYASMAMLTRFDFDGFKLDGGFAEAVQTDEKARVFVRSIGRIGADMNLPVTAEGIETAEQLRMMASLGINRGQGFHIGKPTEEAMSRVAGTHAGGRARLVAAPSP